MCLSIHISACVWDEWKNVRQRMLGRMRVCNIEIIIIIIESSILYCMQSYFDFALLDRNSGQTVTKVPIQTSIYFADRVNGKYSDRLHISIKFN